MVDPLFSLFLGSLILAAMWIGGNLRDGLLSLGVMAAVGSLFLFGSWSETLRGLGGPGRDERWAMIDIHATALTGLFVLAVLIGTCSGSLRMAATAIPTAGSWLWAASPTSSQ